MEGDVADAAFCSALIDQTMSAFGRLDVLVSNAAHQNRKSSIEEVSDEEFDRTFKINVYAYFRLVKAALPHLKPGSAIIVTGSETGFQGPEALPDYSATKGAIHTLTKSLAKMLANRGIRVNCVAPGPVWTPLNVADVGQPPEKVTSFITGEILAVMGGGTAPG
jgi:NAD(P)-dependent dehydrogenase (short-subunit alcohol dehydrogenase family)